jgi:uncharacterized protein YjiS (DUF1127 family)
MSLLTVFITAASAWADWRHRRLAHDELMALDDRLLADIGLRRTELPAMFNEKARRDSADAQGAMALSALQARLVFGRRGLPPIWPQL